MDMLCLPEAVQEALQLAAQAFDQQGKKFARQG